MRRASKTTFMRSFPFAELARHAIVEGHYTGAAAIAASIEAGAPCTGLGIALPTNLHGAVRLDAGALAKAT